MNDDSVSVGLNSFWCGISILLDDIGLEKLGDWVFERLAVQCR